MTDRKFAVYHYGLIDRRFTHVNGKQADVYVAAPSQKRAAELFGIRSNDIATYGGVTHQKPVQEMCRAEPEVVFVKISHSVYARLDEIEDETKRITLDLKDEELYGRETESPAFGMIHINRVSGQENLFMVDYPQDHYLRLTISTAKLNRNTGSDRVMSDRDLIVISLSEVQWARMISSPNSQGVACTLSRYFEPETGEYVTPRLPDRHAADADTFIAEVQDRARKSTVGIQEARTRLADIMKGPLRKGDLQEVEELLRMAEMMMSNNLPYVLERAAETIADAVDNAKSEVDAHIDFAMTRLGERALGARLQQALEAGVDVGQVGRNVSIALDDQTEKPD